MIIFKPFKDTRQKLYRNILNINLGKAYAMHYSSVSQANPQYAVKHNTPLKIRYIA